MIEINELENFERMLQSGQVDDMFKYGDEKERIAILNLLEKLMDVGELADQVATRLLMPNIAGKGSESK